MLFGVKSAIGHDVATGAATDSRDNIFYETQGKRISDVEVHFRLDDSELDMDYMGNGASMQRFAKAIDSIGLEQVDSVVIVSQSSPEGVYEHNIRLSEKRAATMRRHVLEAYPSLSERLRVHPDGESWLQLRRYVQADTLMKQSTIAKVLAVIDADVNVGTKKWRMQQLPVYRYLLGTYYPHIRNSVICIIYYGTEAAPMQRAQVVLPPPSAPAVPEIEVEQPAVTAVAAVQPVELPSAPATWLRRLHVKSNAIGWAMGISNVGAEIDLLPHWSFSLPVYYSAWNYFKSTIKFRTFAVQPELRWWPSADNDGLYVGAHFGMAYYNIALNGDYRYQDHNRETPALGGGVSVGYRLALDRQRRWRVEFSLGAGVYSVHYDKFRNTPDVKDGLFVGSEKKTFFGIDRAAVTFSYTFDLHKTRSKR